MSRGSLRRWLRRRSLWAMVVAALAAPVCALNLSVAFFGNTLVFPLSPFFLKEKLIALGKYGAHRPKCLMTGHGPLEPLVTEAERRHGVPPGLLSAVLAVESKTEPHRISRAGAMGPGQLTDATARRLGVDDPFDPAEAIDGSARFLAANLKQLGRLELAVAAYNAGPTAAAHGIPRNGETEFYVPKVLAEYARRRPEGAAAYKSKR